MNTLIASDFKATCLDVLDRVASGELDRVAITKRGKVVGVLYPPEPDVLPESVFGCLRGAAVIHDPDLAASTVTEAFDAESGLLHR